MVLACSWIAALIAIAVCASNPVTLNRRQILRALDEGVIVRARVLDVETGQCEAIECWPAAEIDGTFHVVNLRRAGANTGSTYLLPLRRYDSGLAVVSSMRSDEIPRSYPDTDDGIPLIYPDTDEALAQLRTLLAQ